MGEVHDDDQPDDGVLGDGDEGPEAVRLVAHAVVLGLELLVEQGAVLVGEPRGAVGLVGQLLPHDEREEHRGDALDDEHPLPAVQAEEAVHLQQQTAERGADDVGEGHPEQLFGRLPQRGQRLG